ncbi:ParB/RepB/Spo0J family partition protein [uncultured Sulfitobacter sp.]|uniref:ParB/RepB/Spo0J family partition protein n=1 Tax=uncultured Sulfitobacter sp. TaxID=191468 RepID=UPI002626226B|nr:ParB/RepB/Spo0J family partition protein [uncultured Sulfitobacter sp.]
MVKKRSVFDINFDPDAEEFPAGNQETVPTDSQTTGDRTSAEAKPRRSPMASAISETVEAVGSRAQTEAAIRSENDALAQEHVRLKKLGLITDLIETTKVKMTKLTRDRSSEIDLELKELMVSIQSVGLSNPIRVEQTDSGYELIQGFRRLAAFRALEVETGDPRYKRIPAALVLRGEPLANLYRKMVDENLVRKDLSFGEMAKLAQSYAVEAQIDVHEAVNVLYASALKQKRTYIRQFARVLEVVGDQVRFPEAIPRSLGLELYRVMEADAAAGEMIIRRLAKAETRDPDDELRILRHCVAEPRKLTGTKPSIKSVSKTSLKLRRDDGDAKVTAENGRLELRMNKDFSALNKEKLQASIEAFLATLDD